MESPQYPAGPFVPEESYGQRRRDDLIAVIVGAPRALRQAIEGLSEEQLGARYRNWSVRQIVNHLADSHVNSYIRFKWALTEELPTIKAYDESRWAALEDSRSGDIAVPLALLDGLHARWAHLLRSMTDEHFSRSFIHPETGQTVTLSAALASYAWHCRHHTAQIVWLRQQRGW